mgnify:CR=1 FL=1
MHALIPESLGEMPGAITYDTPPSDASSLAAVGFFVPRYMGPPSDLALTAEMPQLKVLQLLTAGFEAALPHVRPGVTLCNAAGVHDASTAELAVGLIIASLRHIDDFARAMPQGEWRYARHLALADRRVVIVGAGGVGRAIARRLEPFETDVVLVGRTARPGVHGHDELDVLLPTADVVVLAVPLDDQTRGMVDAAFLGRLADGALLVNMARGPVVRTDDLLSEVASGRLIAAMDVTDPEPLPPEHPLWRTPGVLISPHVGGNTSAFLPRARRLVAAQLAAWQEGAPLRNVIAAAR